MKHFLTLFASLLVCLYTIAALRTPEEAMRIAASLGQDNHAARIPARQPQDLTHCYTALQSNGDPALYVFNRGEDEGFVLISAEDRAKTVLGYADNGHWDEAHMSDATRMWIRNYCKQISRIASQPANTLKAPVGVKKATQQKQYNAISPICQTTWGQGTPYNNQCPTVGGNNCVTGCVATAGAQIMKVFNYPTSGTGTHSYEWTRGENDVVQMSETFGATYNWSKMLNDYSYTSGTTTQRNAVATLMYHCGIVSEMQYGVYGSSTSCNLMLAGMVNHFNYDAGVQALVKDCMTDANFVAGIVSELEQGRPVMFSGRTIKDEGHAFIGDGVDADGLIHINWGWYGSCDGYFQVSAMDPEGQGIGGSLTDEAYTEQIVAFTHIRPNVGGSYQYTLVCDTVHPDETVIDRSLGYVILLADTLENTSLIALANTSSALKVYDENGNFLQYCTFNDYSYDGLRPGYYYYSQPVIGDVSGLGVGKYYISPVMKIGSTYVPIQVRGYSDYRCSMQITQDKIYLNAPEPSLVNDIDPTTADYTLLRTYSYPSTINCGHYWTVQLSTANFYNADATDQMLLFLGFTSASPRSIVGSYVADGATNFQLHAASVYQGNVNTYQKVAAQNGEVTIVYNNLNDTYTIHYMLVINGTTYVGQSTIPSYSVWSGYGEDYLTHKTYDTIVLDNTQYTGLTVSQALLKLTYNGEGWESEIPYIIEGEIKSLSNTPAQIVNYGNCRLYLTDGDEELYSYNTKWLHDQAFQTGYEIEVGGVAAIIGKLKYYGTTKEINAGYFYQYDAPGTIREYGIMTDAENESYHEVFDSYEMEINALDESGSSNYYAYIIAQQDNAIAKLFLFPAAGVDTLSPGTYVFSDEITPFGAWQGYGVNSENNIIGSYAAHTNQNSILIPLWYPRSGTVTVNSRGVITVNATNSYGQPIFFRMANLGGRGIEQTQAEDPAAQKILRNGILYIRRNGIEYTIDGGVCGRNTAKP